MKDQGNSDLAGPQVQIKEKLYKRPFDLTVLVLAHVFPLFLLGWILLWALIPLLIWLEDRGPVFYRQRRMGKNGRVISVLKFRTMVPDADRKGGFRTVEGDPRLTRVGRVLRRTALDELPEILNIWKGDMSLVGPRALDMGEQKWLETLIPGFEKRLRVRPGLTGLAQVYNRNDESHAKLRYDLVYIEHMSLWLDLKVLFLSVWNTVSLGWDRRAEKTEN